MGIQIVSGGASGGPPPVTGLSAGEALAVNQAVMIDAADNQVWVCTVAKAAQVIGIMKTAVALGIAVNNSDIAFSGEIVDAIAGIAVVRGDRLTVQVLPGRLGPLNLIAAHDHTAFQVESGGQADGGFMYTMSEGGGGGDLKANGRFLGLIRSNAIPGGGDNINCITSDDGAITTGTIIAKALETQASVGATFKVLLLSAL